MENKENLKKNKKVFCPVSQGFITPSGSKMAMRYKREYSPKLKREIVVEAGEIDFYEFIQASSNGTDLELLKRQAKQTGIAPEVLPSAQFGVDTRVFPKDIHELYRLANNATDIFNNLTDDEKSAFKGPEDFIESTLKGTAKDILSAHYKKIVDEKLKAAEQQPAAESEK